MYYTQEQLVERAKQMEGFEGIPEDYWLCGIRMNKHDRKPNQFNDVTNLMHGEELVLSTTSSTVPGSPALLGKYLKYNKKGAAVIKSNIWMMDCFKYGLHNGKMEALRQVKSFYVYRDGDKDNIAEQLGKPIKGNFHTNFHGTTYNKFSTTIRKYIGEYSYGCWVNNNRQEYNKIIELTKNQDFVSAIILDEFSV